MHSNQHSSSPPRNPHFGQMYKPPIIFQEYAMPINTVLKKQPKKKLEESLSLPSIKVGQKRLKTMKMQNAVTLDSIQKKGQKQNKQEGSRAKMSIKGKKKVQFEQVGASLRI